MADKRGPTPRGVGSRRYVRGLDGGSAKGKASIAWRKGTGKSGQETWGPKKLTRRRKVVVEVWQGFGGGARTL